MRQLQGQEEWKEEYNENLITVCYFIVIYGHILYIRIIQQPPK